MAKAVGVPWRDLEIIDVIISDSFNNNNSSIAGNASNFHTIHLTVQVAFNVKVSDPNAMSVDKISANMRKTYGLTPRLWLAYADDTSLKDMYLTIISFGTVSIRGDASKGRPKEFSLSELLTQWGIIASPLFAYFLIIGVICPFIVWMVKIRPRRYKLYGRFQDILPEYKGNWAFNICVCMEHKAMVCSLLFCLPARLAETWDTVGVMPFWSGVRRATCCCFLYLIPFCIPCAAAAAGHQRSNIRDFFGFGDGKEDNIEFADCCCYVCCPVCCIVQEAQHVDSALKFLPPPQENPEWMFEFSTPGSGEQLDEPQMAIQDAERKV
jgi:hypothetical protein